VLAAQDERAAASKLAAPTVEPKADTKVCPSCATSNDVDAVFCKKCGHRFESAASASDAGEADASNESNESKGAEDER
jgi:ribosomal protein L40E